MFTDFITVLTEMFSYTFIVRAFIVGTLVSVCSALLGVSLVLKRYSMIGDGLSHVGFGSLALASALHLAPLAVSIPIIITAAFLLLRLSENSKIKGDAAIALICTSSLAIGVVIISATTGMNTDVCNYLFGSILAMSKTDVYLSIALSVTVLTLFVVFYNKLFAITFDETFAKATGVKTGVYNMLIAFLTAITIVLGMRMMGAMLISSLIIFPALTSMRLFKKFKSVTLCSGILSVTCFFIGVIISYIYATPTGASVVMINILAFLLFWAAGAFIKDGRTLKKAPLAALAALSLFSGCGNTKTVFQKSNAAGTLSVSLPAETLAGAQTALPPPAGAYKEAQGAASPSTEAFEKAQAAASSPTEAFEKAQAAASSPKEAAVLLLEPREKTVVEIGEKMFIAQTNDIYLNAGDYLGKTIQLEGLFKAEQYGDQSYCFVIRYGPGCCGNDGNAGFEIAWDNQNAEASYPAVDDWVKASGVLRTYEEDGYPYLYLALSSLDVLDTRGAEFVTQ